MDWGEPACWACGRFEAENDVTDSKLKLDDIFKVWDQQKYLERCHVIPKAIGGCNCYGNIVLLCKECHRDNPDTDNVEMFRKWIQNRKNYSERRYEAYLETFKVFGLEMNFLNIYLLHESKEFQVFFQSKSISVGKKYTAASIVSTFKEWRNNFSNEELITKVPEEFKKFLLIKDPNHINIRIILNYFQD
ncbi:MAG: hypothetical protein ACI9Y7_003220, partial [Dokdonia sp.]